jgi:predicted transcriptional regulator
MNKDNEDRWMPHGNQKVTDEQIIAEFRQTEDPYLTASELAELLPMTRQGIHERLVELRDDGVLGRKKTGRTVGWWLDES